MSARKDDANKPPISLLPRSALLAAARVMGKGKARYGADNWRSGAGLEWRRLIDAAMRHTMAFADGEDFDLGDTGSGELHLANAICCLAFLIEYYEKGIGTDDRFKPLTEAISREPTPESNVYYEVHAHGGLGTDALVYTCLSKLEAEIYIKREARNWPTFILEIVEVNDGHPQTA